MQSTAPVTAVPMRVVRSAGLSGGLMPVSGVMGTTIGFEFSHHKRSA